MGLSGPVRTPSIKGRVPGINGDAQSSQSANMTGLTLKTVRLTQRNSGRTHTLRQFSHVGYPSDQTQQ